MYRWLYTSRKYVSNKKYITQIDTYIFTYVFTEYMYVYPYATYCIVDTSNQYM